MMDKDEGGALYVLLGTPLDDEAWVLPSLLSRRANVELESQLSMTDPSGPSPSSNSSKSSTRGTTTTTVAGTNSTRTAARHEDAAVVSVEVDVIIPVHNAASTIREAVHSALRQRRTMQRPGPGLLDGDVHDCRCPPTTSDALPPLEIVVHVCCYDDGSTDDSWKVLQDLVAEVRSSMSTSDPPVANTNGDPSEDPLSSVLERRGATPDDNDTDDDDTFWEARLHISQSPDGVSRGAGYARNRAVELRPPHRACRDGDGDDANNHADNHHQFLCLLDSDDVMDPGRVVAQVRHMLSLSSSVRDHCLVGCNFARDPVGSTAHYTAWANGLTDDRLALERFREVTLLQPTWMMTRSRFDELGGYLEAPHPSSGPDMSLKSFVESLSAARPTHEDRPTHRRRWIPPLIHPEETFSTLRLAEDLRLFHAHLASNGVLMKCPGDEPLVVYRHHAHATSQSASTPRRLLLQIRALAFERFVLERDPIWGGKFVVWGAGRDGKDFCKALSAGARSRVCCMADVDDAKICSGSYVNPQLGATIPIVHFSYLARDDGLREVLTRSWREGKDDAHFGRIDKSQANKLPVAGRGDPISNARKRKLTCEQELDLTRLPHLPVVVCVAMYRTGGALEKNVLLIGRTEGKDLWHFS